MFIADELYAQILEYSVIPTADIIFLNKDKKILLGLRNNVPLQGVYYIPGGRIQKGETMIEAARRKAKEEINIDINTAKLQFIGVYEDIYKDPFMHYIPCTFAYPLSEQEETNIKVDEQHSELSFFAYNDPTLHPLLQERLQTIQNGYKVFKI